MLLQIKKKFFSGVRKFYQSACDYMIRKVPFHSNVLKHSRFVDIKQSSLARLDDVYYFLEKYNEVLNFSEDDINKIDDEFISFQQFDISTIPDCVWEKARVREKCAEE